MSLGTMEQRTEGIKKQAQQLIEQAYHRGFKAGREDRQDWEKDQADRLIEQGRNEAWEAVKKLYLSVPDGGLPGAAIKEIFGAHNWIGIVRNFSASEVVEKIRAYEEKQKEESEIRVGDEVIIDGGRKMIVSGRDCGGWYHLLSSTGLTYDQICSSDIKKTGRHFPEIVEVLKKMKEDE